MVAVLRTAQAAALEEALWPDVVDGLAGQLGAVSGLFAVLDSSQGVVTNIQFTRQAGDMADEYASTWAPLDPQVAHVNGLSRSTVYVDTDHVREDDPETAAYRAWERRGGIDHHLTAVALLGDDRTRVGLSFHRRVGAGEVPEADRRTLAALLPDLRASLQIGFRYSEMLLERYWEGLTAKGGDPALLLDERGCVVRATGSALALTGEGEGLRLIGGRLGSDNPADNGRLAETLGIAVRPFDAQAGAVRVRRRSGRRSLVVVAHPLARSRRSLAPFEAAALVRIVDPASGRGAPDLFRAAFGLTARETDLARLLGEGHSPESAAAVLGIALPTARVHLQRVLTKTGAGRQTELVRLWGRVAVAA